MKTIKILMLLVIFSLTSFCYANEINDENNSEDQERRIKLVLAGDYWCPYNCHPDDDNPGYLVELLQRALYIYRIDVEYRIMPWSDALRLAELGEIDGVFGISSVNGRKLVTTRLPLEYSSTHAFTRNETEWVYDGVNSLRGRKVGIIMDYIVDEKINHYIGINYPINTSGFLMQEGENAVIESIADLIDGDTDVYLEDKRVVNRYVNENGLDIYIRDAGSVSTEKLPVYIAFSQELPLVKRYLEYFTEGMASIKATGELEDLRRKYKMEERAVDKIVLEDE